MAAHALAFLDGLGVKTCDVLGFSLGGMVAQQIAQDRPSMFRRMILVGTAPRGGEDIMHLQKPTLAGPMSDSTLRGYGVLQKIFFAPTESSQAAGKAFIDRLAQRKEDVEPASGPAVASAQMASFRDWEQFAGTRFADLKNISQPTLVVNGVHDEMIPVSIRTLSASIFRTRCCSRIPTPGMVPCSSFTSPSRGRRPHFSRRTVRLRRSESS
jgi:pimeloyl-ACP methyl ester carboxylesterase